ncbi:hypothetical protein WJX74_005674 [Apatococcus lobatus]|uniref:K Homology domain-containing protein n=1 Tax=Apatococcus lobatus TaxID=904363 RepID=A0AAW1REX7_9CHLO
MRPSGPGHKRPAAELESASQVFSSQQTPAKRPALEQPLTFRILCPKHKVGSVIGKGGKIVSQIRRDTGARIKIEEALPSCTERIISISGPSSGDSAPHWSPAQEALLSLHTCITEAAPSRPSSAHQHHQPHHHEPEACARLLLEAGQAGRVLGHAGRDIAQLRQETGAIIRVLERHDPDFPTCAGAADGALQISGSAEGVQRGLKAACIKLKSVPQWPSSHNQGRYGGPHAPPSPNSMHSTGTTSLDGSETGLPSLSLLPPLHMPSQPMLDKQRMPVETEYRVLVPDAHVGSIIGHNGDLIRKNRAETGASVKVFSSTQGCAARVAALASLEEATTSICKAQDALVRCCHGVLSDQASAAASAGTGTSHHTVCLLAPTPQVGAILGKAGSIVAQIRAETGAGIRIHPVPMRMPRGMGENDEIIQIDGNKGSCIAAVRRVATLLRGWMVRQQTKTGNSPASADSPLGRGGWAGFNPGPSLQPPMGDLMFNGGGLGSFGGPPTPPGPHPFGSLDAGLGSFNGSLGGSGLGLGPLGPPMGMSNHVPSRLGPRVNQPLQLVLSQLQVGCIMGRAGANMSQIRQISGARIKLHSAANQEGNRELEISGTPEQIQSAQNLFQAFLLAGGAPPMIGPGNPSFP